METGLCQLSSPKSQNSLDFAAEDQPLQGLDLFEYRRLANLRGIRFLKVLPANLHEAIRCIFEERTVEDMSPHAEISSHLLLLG